MAESEVLALAQQWLSWDFNVSTKSEIEELVQAKDVEALEKRFTPRIRFGTSGLRARMEAGFARMNDLVILQTSQGLYKYLEETLGGEDLGSKGLVVGYDARFNSKRFAHICAAVFLAQGVPVTLYSQYAATPLIPFAILRRQYAAGVVVTASHNPKDDNGFKVYWGNGAAIIPPHDGGISAAILANLAPWSESLATVALMDDDLEAIRENPLCTCDFGDNLDAYVTHFSDALLLDAAANTTDDFPIVYTAMHGVGYPFVQRAFEAFGLKAPVPVPAQVEPDPEFPTVPFPNPEEGKGALQLAFETAAECGATLVLANDPDADRLAVAELQADGSWYVFNGNELGIVLGRAAFATFQAKHPDVDAKDCVFCSTAVSSSMLKAFAESVGATFCDTLTGFKWMGNKAISEIANGKHFIFAYEEAIGFMIGDTCFDKDGIRAAAFLGQMMVKEHANGRRLHDSLVDAYNELGQFVIETRYFFCYDPDVMQAIFNRVRTMGPDGGYPTHCGTHAITRVRDQTTGHDSGEADGKTVLPVTPNGQMITFWFEDGTVATIRGSGTEPKLKYYVECRGDDARTAIEAKLHAMQQVIIDEWLQPEQNGLVAQKTD